VSSCDPRLFGDLLLAIGVIENRSNSRAVFGFDGVIEFRSGNRILGAVVIASGRGVHRWAALEAEVRQSRRHWTAHDPRPLFGLVSGVLGERPEEITPPDNITGDEDAKSILYGDSILTLDSADEIREDAALIDKILA
jgi:hypothetical protein